MKNYSCYSLILIFNLIVITSCAKTENNPDNFQSLLGKWTLTKTIIQQEGKSDIIDSSTGGVGEFFSDGRLVSTDTSGSVIYTVNWKLVISQMDGRDIDAGVLTVSGDAIKEAAQIITGKDVYEFEISTYVLPPNNVVVMQLILDAPYPSVEELKGRFIYFYHKL